MYNLRKHLLLRSSTQFNRERFYKNETNEP